MADTRFSHVVGSHAQVNQDGFGAGAEAIHFQACQWIWVPWLPVFVFFHCNVLFTLLPSRLRNRIVGERRIGGWEPLLRHQLASAWPATLEFDIPHQRHDAQCRRGVSRDEASVLQRHSRLQIPADFVHRLSIGFDCHIKISSPV
jgi:hypothetical protein